MSTKPRNAQHPPSALDKESRIYMFGHLAMSKAELKTALEAAKNDPELSGSLRMLVLERYAMRIAGKEF